MCAGDANRPPVIGGALNLLTKELAAHGITLDSATYHTTPQTPSASSEKAPENPFYRSNSFSGFYNQPVSTPEGFLFQSHGGIDSFGPDPMAMEPGVFEAMSSLEPLSAWVGTIHNFDPPHGPR